MHKKFIYLFPFITFILLNLGSFAQDHPTVTRTTIIEQYKGKSYYMHFVKAGETLEEIANAYNVASDIIKAENPEAQQKLYANQVLKIPVTYSTASPPKEGESENGRKAEAINETPKINAQQEKRRSAISYIEYIVKKKETLYGISKQFDVGMEDIIAGNPGLQGIQEGMILRIPEKGVKSSIINEQKVMPAGSQQQPNPIVTPYPAKSTSEFDFYEVQPKETLYSIAHSHGISVEKLIEINPDLIDLLKAGQVIRVPKAPVSSQKSDKSETATKPETEKPEISTPETSVKPVIESSDAPNPNCKPKLDKGKQYHVALLLPFSLSDADSLLATDISKLKPAGAYRPFNFIQIYEGALLALDSLEKTGANVKFYVYDADNGNDTIKTRKILTKPEMKDMDLIIGPVFARSFATAARFAEKQQINIINPLSRRSEIVRGNPFIYKVQPSEDAIAFKLSTFIVEKYPQSNVIIVRNTRAENPELAKLVQNEMKAALLKAGKGATSIPVTDIIYQTEFFGGISKRLSLTKQNIVIVLSNNSVLIPDFISRLNGLTKDHQIILIGMPGWETLEPETDYLVNLNYHQYSTSWVDYENVQVLRFVKRFRDKFATEPENDKYAFLGYDLTFYFIKALMDYGHDFGPCVASNPANVTEPPFRFRKSGESDGYENSKLNILKIEDYHWVDAEK
jgi:LysM repeat protein/ABC-type branched-subunit amino acid transport system substrate-binding protein